MRLGTFISGLFLVLFGTALLLINFGYGSWNIMVQLGKWWPVLLILLGLAIFNSGKIPRFIAFVFLLLSVLAVGVYLVREPPTRIETEDYPTSTLIISRQQYPQVKQANLTVDCGGGQLQIVPGTDAIFQADFSGGEIKRNILPNDEALKIDLSQTGNQWSTGQIKANRWKIQVSPELFWNLNINAGAIDGIIDLTGVPLRQLNCSLGAGNMNFILNNNGPHTQFRITAGASSIKLEIPGTTGVSIKMGGALNTTNLDELGWTKAGSSYHSPNYAQAVNKIDCDIQLSAGSLEVITIPTI